MNISINENPQMIELLLVQSELDKITDENHGNKEKIVPLENEVKSLQKQNNDLSLAKSIILQHSSPMDPIDHLAKALVDMSIKKEELNKVKEELIMKHEEVKNINEKL